MAGSIAVVFDHAAGTARPLVDVLGPAHGGPRGGGEQRGRYLRDLDVGGRLAVAREGGGALLGGGGDGGAQPREPLDRELVERAWLWLGLWLGSGLGVGLGAGLGLR